MRDALKACDRVRVTKANRVPSYQEGDAGTLLWVSDVEDEANYFIVAMDRDTHQRPVVFAKDEIRAGK